MRAADDRVPRDRCDLLPGHACAEFREARHHCLRPVRAVVADQGGLGAQCLVGRVEEVGEQVDAALRGGLGGSSPRGSTVELAGQLHAGDQGKPGGQRGLGLGEAGLRVMVGKRDHVEPGARRTADHLRRGIGTVGSAAVHMQVNTHHQSS